MKFVFIHANHFQFITSIFVQHIRNCQMTHMRMCVHLSVCLSIYAGIRAHGRTYGDHMLTLVYLFVIISPPYLLRKYLSLSLKVNILTTLTGQCQRIIQDPLVFVPHCWGPQVCVHSPSFVTLILGMQIQLYI